MSLRRALDELPGDRAHESTTREVLEFFRVHPDTPFAAADVSRRLERADVLVSAILSALAGHFVLGVESGEYVYRPDAFTEMEIGRFLKRADSHSALIQANVAKFRGRYGYR